MLLDNASFHGVFNKEEYKSKNLNITPIWNVPYCPEYNSAIERYWANLKSKFRPIYLQKMLERPHSKTETLKKALYEAFEHRS